MPPETHGNVAFEDISFSYPARKAVTVLKVRGRVPSLLISSGQCRRESCGLSLLQENGRADVDVSLLNQRLSRHGRA
jgi:hypothetical protein